MQFLSSMVNAGIHSGYGLLVTLIVRALGHEPSKRICGAGNVGTV